MREAMDAYFGWLLAAWKEKFGTLPKVPYDDTVDPVIYDGEPDEDEWISWRPLPKTTRDDLRILERKFATSLPRSLDDYFNTYWFCSLGGHYRGVGVDLRPVLPGHGIQELAGTFARYRAAHDGALSRATLGVEKNGRLVVVRAEDGAVQLEDYAPGTFEDLAPDLETLIAGLR
jgi:hypothetical protein